MRIGVPLGSFSESGSSCQGGKIIRIQAKRRYGCRIELPGRLQASTLLKTL
jgi:hypothetical protein